MHNYWCHHIHLVSPNLAETAKFYERMFSAKVVGTRQLADGRTNIDLDLNGLRIFVVSPKVQPEPASASSSTGYGIDHLALETENLEAAVDDLKAKGAEFTEEIKIVRPGLRVVAPDNVQIELLERSK